MQPTTTKRKKEGLWPGSNLPHRCSSQSAPPLLSMPRAVMEKSLKRERQPTWKDNPSKEGPSGMVKVI